MMTDEDVIEIAEQEIENGYTLSKEVTLRLIALAHDGIKWREAKHAKND